MRSRQLSMYGLAFVLFVMLNSTAAIVAQDPGKNDPGKTDAGKNDPGKKELGKKDPKQETGNFGGGLQIAQVSGTIQAMAQNQIKVVTEDKKEYLVLVTDQTSVQFQGTADPEFLMPGLLVRFTADLTQTGLVQSPVSELEVFTYSQSRRMTPEQMRDQTAGVYQVGEAANANKAGAKESPKRTQPKQTAASNSSGQSYRVVGQVVGVQAGKTFVQAGPVRVQFELDPKATINVRSRDMTFFQTGDQVKVSGLRNASQEQYIQSESVEVVGAKPLGPAEGKIGAKTAKSSKSKSKRGKADATKDTDDDDKKSDAKKPDAKKTATK